MINLLVEWSGMAWPRAWSFETTEMPVEHRLNWSLFLEHLQIGSIHGVSATVVEQYPRALLVALVPADDRSRVTVQVDRVI